MEGDVCEKNLERFFENSYAAFIVTCWWDKSCKGKEKDLGMLLVDAARKTGVQHLIYSTLPNVDRISKGKIHLPKFTDKALVEEHIRELQNSNSPPFKYVSFFGPSFYYQNFLKLFAPKKEGEKFVFTLPETSSLTMFDATDTGEVVAAMLSEPEKTNGKLVAVCGIHGSPQEMFEILKRDSEYGDRLKLNLISREEYAKSGREHAEEISQMFEWFEKFTFFGPEIDRDCAKKLGVSLTRFEDWAATSFKLEPTLE